MLESSHERKDKMSRVYPSESGIAIDQLIKKAKRSAAPVEALVRGEEMVVVVMPKRDYEQLRAIREAAQSLATRSPKTRKGYLAETMRVLRRYEKKYGMKSAEFYRRFQTGELGEDERDYFDWRVEYNSYRRLKRRVADAQR
jgi:PHD/YefM family antitoxin component YafN of YafNO toxin-antitoxin module